jgi:hypothetical protein
MRGWIEPRSNRKDDGWWPCTRVCASRSASDVELEFDLDWAYHGELIECAGARVSH